MFHDVRLGRLTEAQSPLSTISQRAIAMMNRVASESVEKLIARRADTSLPGHAHRFSVVVPIGRGGVA